MFLIALPPLGALITAKENENNNEHPFSRTFEAGRRLNQNKLSNESCILNFASSVLALFDDKFFVMMTLKVR
jgi:hypothetical protein